VFDFRYHALSLVAVFIALTVGLVLGVAIGDQGLVSSAEKDLRASLRRNVVTARADAASARKELADRRQIEQDDFFPVMVGDRLSAERIGVVAFGDMPDSLVQNTKAALDGTGARFASVSVVGERLDLAAIAAASGKTRYAKLVKNPALAGRLENPLLVGELGGNMPYGFHLQNSPAEMERRVELDRPVILLSSSGTGLLTAAAARNRTYAACLRNARAQAQRLIAAHEHVLLLAGEHRIEFREEDRLCCGRIAGALMAAGFEPRNALVEEIVKRWADASDDAFMDSRSVRYLADTGQLHDAEFVLEHIDDLDSVYEMRHGELVPSNEP
jgi:2-phosphosulfolactate phosphatase